MDIWAKAEHVALLAEKSYIGKARPPDDSELTPFFHDKLWLEAKTPRFLDGSAAILVFGQKGSRELARRLNHRLPCPVYWIQSFPGPDSHEHVHHFLLEQLRHLGWPIPECLPDASSVPPRGLFGKNLFEIQKPDTPGQTDTRPSGQWRAAKNLALEELLGPPSVSVRTPLRFRLLVPGTCR